MLQLNYLRENVAVVRTKLEKKNFKQLELIQAVLSKDEERRAAQKKLDDTLAETNNIAREVGNLFKTGRQAEAESLKARATQLKDVVKSLETECNQLMNDIENILVQLPNLPHESVPAGFSHEDNEIVFSSGQTENFPSDFLPHWELSEKYKLIDFENGSKITGSGFPVYRGQMAKLQRALIQYFLDKANDAGYFEVQPPYVINADSGFGTGQLPDKEGQMYHIQADDLYLIPTAEVPVTNLFRNSILQQHELPTRYVAYSACFRREAGSYGKDVRGLNRLHQFDKVEIVVVAHPDDSYAVLDDMCQHVGQLIADLGLPYRKLRLCGGDMSFASALTFDFEVFAAGQQRWLEVSSVSNFETFQSVRMKLRAKGKDGKMFIPHTLNGSALALPRIVAAIIENNQTPDGIRIPSVLKPYLGFDVMNNISTKQKL